ncbi:uncharacterized protein LOC143445179 [Clavelina lepadiformis]|uniref:SAGA-associated factor 11 homolog n=1 Tax=Clavelina lepadiformis TaxID=159417 RepID=A0ABP0FAB2_CLALP
MADLQMYADHFLNEFLNEAILGVSYEVHRSLTKRTLFLDENGSDEDDTKYKIVVENGLDIFGQAIGGSKKHVECLCPNCNRNMAASRFAPHLEKCMGMGRNSSRIASQRIANSGKFASSMNDTLGTEDDLDDVNDADWFVACESSTSTRKSKKRKADRSNGLARTSKSKNSPKSGPSHSSSQSDLKLHARRADHNDNIRILNVRHNPDSSNKRNENINQTISLWQQHINATLSGHDGNGSKSLMGVAPASGIVKKSKKTTKHSHSKKNKKRQISSQQSIGLS